MTIEYLESMSDLEAEQATLAGLIIYPEKILDVADDLKPGDFKDGKHQDIYEAMLALHARRVDLDIITLADELSSLAGKRASERGPQIPTPTAADLAAIQASPVSAYHIGDYVNILKRKSAQRAALLLSTEIAGLSGRSNGTGPDDLFSQIQKMIDDAREGYKPKRGPRPLGEIIGDVYDETEAASQNDSPVGIPTGITTLDLKFQGGLQRDELTILAGRPGMGKTAMATQMGVNAAKRGARVLIFSLEMSDKALGRRYLALETGIPSNIIKSAKLKDEQWSDFYQGTRDGQALSIWIDETPALSAGDMRTRARRLAMEQGLDLIIIDYLQLMGDDGEPSRFGNMHLRITERVHALKNLAKELHIPVVVLSQLNRAVEGRQDKRPLLSDLRESGSIEETADVVMFIYRDDVYNPDTEYPNIAEVIIAKQRDGETGTISLYFKKHVTSFVPLEVKVQSLEY